jgi:hypothetical protein
MKDMNIQSNFDQGDKVWVYRNEDGKYYEGTVREVQSWDKWNGFRYEIVHNGEEEISINAEEKFVFNSREEIINTRFVAES